MAQPLSIADEEWDEPLEAEGMGLEAPRGAGVLRGEGASVRPTAILTIDAEPPRIGAENSVGAPGGQPLGTFKNTYYDFPHEADYQGESVALKAPNCETIKRVPRPFYETLCVQGSGMLSNNTTVSFNRRGCQCAEICPRTKQRICFEALDVERFPWGRGATGRAITPLLTVAVDPQVIPIGTALYVPEFDGLPRDPSEQSVHDGCFIAQDKGLKVKGKHLDVFTGQPAMTRLWNKLVPSNQGVTVVLRSPRCARAPLGRLVPVSSGPLAEDD
jgi:3D (Asp-Asp-Asp) domain-containing protein